MTRHPHSQVLPAYLEPYRQYLVFESKGERTRRILLGGLAGVVLAFLLTVGLLLNDNIRLNRTGIAEGWLIALLCMTICLAYVAFHFFVSMLSRNAPARLNGDPRAPILFLRSFAADQRVGAGPERDLERAVRRLAPLIAVGFPGERVPPVGAARLYVGHDKWQGVIRALMAHARLVILRVGETSGFWWEFEECVRANRPERTLIFIPPGDRRRSYRAFRMRAERILTVALPDPTRRAMFMAFRAGWAPYFLEVESGSVRIRRWLLRAPLYIALRDALRSTLPVGGTKLTLQEGATIVAIGAVALAGLTIWYSWDISKQTYRAKELAPIHRPGTEPDWRKQ